MQWCQFGHCSLLSYLGWSDKHFIDIDGLNVLEDSLWVRLILFVELFITMHMLSMTLVKVWASVPVYEFSEARCNCMVAGTFDNRPVSDSCWSTYLPRLLAKLNVLHKIKYLAFILFCSGFLKIVCLKLW